MLTEKEIKELNKLNCEIRKTVLKIINKASSGHTASSLGLVEILSYLYFKVLNIDPKKPELKSRDFMIVSNGHIAPLLYTVLAYRGFFEKKELNTLRKLGSRLQGHPHYKTLPGIENTSGPLGEGISQAVGIASILKREKKKNRVFCLLGDGELEEGEVWEAFNFVKKENLNNLIMIIDYNDIQIDGKTERFFTLEELHKRLLTYNFGVIECDGNDIKQVDTALNHLLELNKNKPFVLLLKTIPGKGVSFIENDYKWHGKAPNDEELRNALKELKC